MNAAPSVPRRRRRPASRPAQRGISLIIVMLILVVVTVLGIGGAQIALLGERSTRYDRDYLIATQAAEAALKDAEADIGTSQASTARSQLFVAGNAGIFVPNCGTGAPAGAGAAAGSSTSLRGLCASPSDADKPIWAQVDFLDDSAAAKTVAFGDFTGRAFQSGTTGVQPERAPRYIVEVADDQAPGGNASASVSPRPKLYRITAIGFGPRKEVQVVMQTAYRKK